MIVNKGVLEYAVVVHVSLCSRLRIATVYFLEKNNTEKEEREKIM